MNAHAALAVARFGERVLEASPQHDESVVAAAAIDKLGWAKAEHPSSGFLFDAPNDAVSSLLISSRRACRN